MDIYIDGLGFACYLTQLLSHLRRERNNSNNSIWNVDINVWSINQTLIKQNLIVSFWQKDMEDERVSEQDADYKNNKYSVREQSGYKKIERFINAILPYLPEVYKREDNIKDFKDDVINWLKYSEITFGDKDDFSQSVTNKFRKESSIFILEDKTLFVGHNETSIIDLKDILNGLKKIFFVEETSLNKTFYTREYNSWESDKTNPKESDEKERKGIGLPLDNEKDIIIVDPYFFQSKSNNFGEDEMAFLRAICGDNKTIERNLVVFFQNCVCSEWLESFSSQFKSEYPNCKLSFIGVKDNRILHDRFIISNYRLFFSGHSFVQYFKNGHFSANGSIGLFVGSVADENNENVMNNAINYLQKEILNSKNHFAYGDCFSYLLIMDKVNTWHSKTKTEEILNVYKEGTIARMEWDDDYGGLHLGKNFIWECNEENKFKFKDCHVRICNIRPNPRYPKQSKYQWIGFPVRI